MDIAQTSKICASFNLINYLIMKKVTLTLIAISTLAFAPSTFAASKCSKVPSAAVSLAKPPHNDLRIGSYHKRIHPHAQRVIVNRQTYYVHNGVYFQEYRRGFVVVQPPRMARPQYYRSHRPATSYRDNHYRQPTPRQCTPAPAPYRGGRR